MTFNNYIYNMSLISNFYKTNKINKKTSITKSMKKVQLVSYIIEPKKINKDRKLFAKKLNDKLAKSEVWFMSLYNNYKDMGDFFNKPLGNYIPDVSNYTFKYVIEIDGSIHNLERVKAHDIKKNQYYSLHGYKVIRVSAYSEDQFKRLIYILNIITRKVILKNAPQFKSQAEIDEYMQRGSS